VTARLLPDDVPAVLTVDELSKVLRIGRRQAYELVHRTTFPAFRVGRSIRVPREGLERWLQESSGEHDMRREASGNS